MAEKEQTAAENREHDIDIGTVRIADDVVAMIAGYAAQEVDGVAEMAGNSTQRFFGKSAPKRPTQGVRVEVADGQVRADLSVIMDYGFNIPATSSKVQARVKQAIENMTGLSVADVNVRIAGIKMPETQEDKDN
ncbi:MAG: Asp23/Gls24 family envelope stress response protein [Lachnospiraceae bacterium]